MKDYKYEIENYLNAAVAFAKDKSDIKDFSCFSLLMESWWEFFPEILAGMKVFFTTALMPKNIVFQLTINKNPDSSHLDAMEAFLHYQKTNSIYDFVRDRSMEKLLGN